MNQPMRSAVASSAGSATVTGIAPGLSQASTTVESLPSAHDAYTRTPSPLSPLPPLSMRAAAPSDDSRPRRPISRFHSSDVKKSGCAGSGPVGEGLQ